MPNHYVTTCKELPMNKLLFALIAGALGAAAPAALAQYNTDKAKQSAVEQSTQSAVDPNGGRATAAQDAKNTKASKKKAKPTKTQKEADLKAMEGTVDSSGSRATAKQDAKNTKASKDVSKQTVKMSSPSVEKELQKAATDK
jgi:hypothetical protein